MNPPKNNKIGTYTPKNIDNADNLRISEVFIDPLVVNTVLDICTEFVHIVNHAEYGH